MRSGSGRAPKNASPKVSNHGSIEVGNIVGRGTMRISSTAKPTASEVAYYKVLKGQLDAVLAEFNAVTSHELADFNRAVADQKITPVTLLPTVATEEEETRANAILALRALINFIYFASTY